MILSAIFVADISSAVCNFLMHWPFSKYSNISFLLFPPSYSLSLFFLLQSVLLKNSYSYKFFEVRFGHRVGMDLTFFRKKLK